MLKYYHYENVTICVVTNEVTGMTFYGEARCAPEDEDKYSERTGNFIAGSRAHLCALRHSKICIEESIREQRHVIDCMRHSSKFNKKSNEYRLAIRHYYQSKEDLEAIKDLIKAEKASLAYYIGHH